MTPPSKAGTRICKCCHQRKSETAFRQIRPVGWRTVYCDGCARENMRRYWAARATVRDPRKLAQEARD